MLYGSIAQDVFNIIDSLATVPSLALNCRLHELLIIVLSFFDILQI